MADNVFVDTNVLLRAFFSTFPEHERVRAMVDQLLGEDCDLWISRQVIREFLVQVTYPHTFTTPLTIEQVIRQVEQIETLFRVADDTHDITACLLVLPQIFPTRGKQIHDANIVATMRYGIERLLTLNPTDFRRYEGYISLLTPNVTS